MIRELAKFVHDIRVTTEHEMRTSAEHIAMRAIEFNWPYDDLDQFVGRDDAPVDKIEHVHMKSPTFDCPLDDPGQSVDEDDTPLDRLDRYERH